MTTNGSRKQIMPLPDEGHSSWQGYDTVWSVARRILTSQGWTRGSIMNHRSPALCVGEAIAVALTGDRMNLYTHIYTQLPDDHPLKQAMKRFSDYVKQETGLLGQRTGPPQAHERVMAWNDSSSRLRVHVTQALNQLHNLDKPIPQPTEPPTAHSRRWPAQRGEQEPRMPSQIYPYEEDGPCQLCGEPRDEEMGEFTLPEPHPNGGTQDHRSVVTHGQCGLDHGLEMA